MSQPKAIVIGASRGIGQGLIGKLEQAGYDTYRTVRAQPSDAKTFRVDLNDPDAASVKAAAAHLDSLDVLIINGAIAGGDSFLDITPDGHRQFYQTNVVGPVTAVQAFLPALRKGKQKTIVFISSLVANAALHANNARQPVGKRFPFSKGPYSATKAAVNLTGISIYNDLSEEGFSVLNLHPGLVRTDLAKDVIALVDAMKNSPFKAITVDESTTGLVEVIQSHITAGKPDIRFIQYDGKELDW